MTWAQLLARVFKIDVETCPHCAGKVKIIAVIEEPKTIRKILDHLGLPSKPPSLTPARGPPLQEYAYESELTQTFPEDF